MYSDLPSELHKEISEYFNPCELAQLAQVDSKARDLIENQDSYNRIADVYELPRFYGDSPLRHLCHYYNILETEDTKKYGYLIDCAVNANDTQWLISRGIGLVGAGHKTTLSNAQLHEYFVKANSLEGLTALAEQPNFNPDIMFTAVLNHGNLEMFKHAKELAGKKGFAAYFDIRDIAARGEEDLANFLIEKYGLRPRNAITGYLIGKRYDLYEKYKKLFQVKESFGYPQGSIVVAIKHNNLEIFRRLIPEVRGLNVNATRFGVMEQSGIIGELWPSFVANKSPEVVEMYDLLKEQAPNWHLNIGDMLNVVTQGNYLLLQRILEDNVMMTTGKTNISKMLAQTNIMKDYSGYANCIRTLLSISDRFRLGETKHSLRSAAVEYGNLELQDIIDQA